MATTSKVVFFVPPGVHLLDMSGPSQAFLAAGQMLAGYPIEHCSFRESIIDSTGLRVCGLAHYSAVKLQAGDFLFLPGYSSRLLTAGEDQKEWQGVYAWLQREAEKGVRLCSVCTGAFILARAGLLTGRPCTTHWSLIPLLRKEFPAIDVREDVLFTEDENIYTSAGISSGIDLALYLLEEDQGPLLAHKVARELVVYFRRSDRHSQESVYLNYRNHLHRGIHELQDWLIANLDTRATIDQMAAMVNMSSRNLTRTFKVQTGISINRYITLLRLELATSLRYSPGITMREIASRCGFANERQLQRIMKSTVVRH
ncbi:GlxA family transcriptional regulator [Puia dinghuensis]|uniref:AraC family transcriptional regulator n=1 Tax=Puia dinghuensis TaxID=1792502 RepID=A0A8J2U7M2_9BACT|nr:DJ-1/PfpI family protein [Puia dinghuensis]GGA84107.1 AraC family transcriptional regulator [Puia dinghuensis]